MHRSLQVITKKARSSGRTWYTFHISGATLFHGELKEAVAWLNRFLKQYPIKVKPYGYRPDAPMYDGLPLFLGITVADFMASQCQLSDGDKQTITEKMVWKFGTRTENGG